MRWEIRVYDNKRQSVLASYTESTPGPILGPIEWRRRASGDCVELRFRAKGGVIPWQPRAWVELYLPDIASTPVFGGVVSRVPTNPYEAEDVLVEGGRALLRDWPARLDLDALGLVKQLADTEYGANPPLAPLAYNTGVSYPVQNYGTVQNRWGRGEEAIRLALGLVSGLDFWVEPDGTPRLDYPPSAAKSVSALKIEFPPLTFGETNEAAMVALEADQYYKALLASGAQEMKVAGALATRFGSGTPMAVAPETFKLDDVLEEVLVDYGEYYDPNSGSYQPIPLANINDNDDNTYWAYGPYAGYSLLGFWVRPAAGQNDRIVGLKIVGEGLETVGATITAYFASGTGSMSWSERRPTLTGGTVKYELVFLFNGWASDDATIDKIEWVWPVLNSEERYYRIRFLRINDAGWSQLQALAGRALKAPVTTVARVYYQGYMEPTGGQITATDPSGRTVSAEAKLFEYKLSRDEGLMTVISLGAYAPSEDAEILKRELKRIDYLEGRQ